MQRHIQDLTRPVPSYEARGQPVWGNCLPGEAQQKQWQARLGGSASRSPDLRNYRDLSKRPCTANRWDSLDPVIGHVC